MKGKRFHIRDKVLVFGLVMSTVPLLLISFFIFFQVKHDLESRIKERQLIIIESMANQMTEDLDKTLHRIELLSAITNVAQNKGVFYDALHDLDSIEEIVLFNKNGLESLRMSRFELDQERDTAFLTKQQVEELQRTKRYTGDVVLNNYGHPVMKMAVPMYSPETGDYSGGIGVTIQLQKIIGEISSQHRTEAGVVYLVDQNDRIIAHEDYSQLWKPFGQRGERDEMLGVATGIPGIDWKLVMERPIKDAYSPIYEMAARSLGVVLIVIGIISLTSIYAGLYFTKPIEKLQKAMKKIQRGSWVESVHVNRRDEMGDLAKAFNEMSKEIREKSNYLLQEKERLNIIVNGIGAGLAVVKSDYTITWMNPLLENWLETDQVELPCYVLLGGQNRPCADCPIDPSCHAQESEDIFRTYEKNGEKKIFRHRIYQLHHSGEADGEFLIVLEDITEQRKMEEKLIQTDKLSALGLMASSFAHEVNNPLATINVYAEDLLDRLEEEKEELVQSKEIDQYLQIIKENTDRCKKITRNLLNFSRKSEWSQKEFDVNEVMQNSIALVHYTFTKNHVDLQVDLAQALPVVHGDSLKLMQVFVNLIHNAVDAMESGGTLSIRTGMDGNAVTIEIEDTGIGIPKDQLQKVFDPFFTTKPPGKGTGLGLSVCYGIVEQFGGTITIDSVEGEGTIVAIKIPLIGRKNGKDQTDMGE